jgi:hypothetical protein
MKRKVLSLDGSLNLVSSSKLVAQMICLLVRFNCEEGETQAEGQ